MQTCPTIEQDLIDSLLKYCPVIVLASQSPNRKALLESAGIKVITKPQNINEICGLSQPAAVVKTLSRQKLDSYLNSPDFDKNIPAVGIDTLVYLEDKLIGKPQDTKEAYEIIKSLSGKSHQVYSGLSMYIPNKGVKTQEVITNVHFINLSKEQINWYVDTGDCMGAAGAYKIQSNGYKLIDNIDGSFSNIIGIPFEKMLEFLQE